MDFIGLTSESSPYMLSSIHLLVTGALYTLAPAHTNPKLLTGWSYSGAICVSICTLENASQLHDGTFNNQKIAIAMMTLAVYPLTALYTVGQLLLVAIHMFRSS